MKAIVTGAEHADYNDADYAASPAQWDRVADAAEFIVAEAIGALDFQPGSADETISVSTGRSTIAVTNNRIIRNVTQLTINDQPVDPADYTVRYWIIQTVSEIYPRSIAVVSYDFGYTESSEMPGQLKEAILSTGSSIFKEGGNTRSARTVAEKLGDWSATYSQSGDSQMSIPPDAQRLLTNYMNPSRLP